MWVKTWVDDGEEIAVSDDGLSRTVVRSDDCTDMEWDDEYSPAVVCVDSHGSVTTLSDWRTWHAGQESDEVSGDLARAVEHYRNWYRASRCDADTCIERYMRLYHGTTAVHRISTRDAEYYVCDSATIRTLWGVPKHYVFSPDYSEALKAWLNGEAYSAHLQTRESEASDWEDSDENVFGLYGYDYACETAKELLG